VDRTLSEKVDITVIESSTSVDLAPLRDPKRWQGLSHNTRVAVSGNTSYEHWYALDSLLRGEVTMDNLRLHPPWNRPTVQKKPVVYKQVIQEFKDAHWEATTAQADTSLKKLKNAYQEVATALIDTFIDAFQSDNEKREKAGASTFNVVTYASIMMRAHNNGFLHY